MNKAAVITAAVLTAFAGLATAQPDVKTSVTRAPGQVTAGGTAKMTATVTAIDPATRKVTLKTTTGQTKELVVGPDARNFEQLKVGDVVTTEYREALTVSLKKGSGPPSRTERDIAERSAPGAKPGGVMGREVTVVADVVAVDKARQVVTVKGAKGDMVDLMVEDPAQLANVKKGDRIQAVYTEAVAIAVEPGPAK